MKTIPVDQILIPENRQRREFDLAALNELGESIVQNGLFHAIVLRKEGEKFFLVSGERRLRAVKDLVELCAAFSHDDQLVPPGQIPYTELGELDATSRRLAELEENIRRVDLTWQEQAAATAEIMELFSQRAAASGAPAPTVRDVTQEVRPEFKAETRGQPHETTRRELIVAKHLSNPEVRAAKSVDDAFKILKRQEETNRRVQLAATVGATYSAGTAHTLLNVDSLKWMSEAATEQFDVICTDPIYGIGADQFGDSGGHTQGAHAYDDSYPKWQADIACLAKEGFRITKPQAHLYCFCDITRFEEAKTIFASAGWKVHRTPIIWHKPNGNRVPWPEQGPQRKYELILYAVKGNKPVTRIYPDLVTYQADENLGHNAQKPVALYTDLLRRSVSPGDAVLDTFCGSAPILAAANELKCRATAIDSDPAAYGIGLERLKRLTDQQELEGLIS